MDFFGFLDDIREEQSDAYRKMRQELEADKRRMQLRWREEINRERRSLHDRIDVIEQKMQAIQRAREESDDGFVDLGATFERLWSEARSQDYREFERQSRVNQYMYDPQIRKVRLAHQGEVNWIKEGF